MRIFGCGHERYTWPRKRGKETYVACLDCGAELRYDLEEMKIVKKGKEIPALREAQA